MTRELQDLGGASWTWDPCRANTMADFPLASQTSSRLIKIQARKQSRPQLPLVTIPSKKKKKKMAFKPAPHTRKVNSTPYFWPHPCRVWALKRPHPQDLVTLTPNRATGCPQTGLACSCPHMRLDIACRRSEDGRRCRPPWAGNPS